MKKQLWYAAFIALGAICSAPQAEARTIFTSDPGGADIEFRETQPGNRGDSGEIASRMAAPAVGGVQGVDPNAGGTGRNSVIYLKFGIQDISADELAQPITVRTHIQNANINIGRLEFDPASVVDQASAAASPNNGFHYYVLDPTLANANWDEMAVTNLPGPTLAPGYQFDGQFATYASGTPSSPTTGLTYLGTQQFRDLIFGVENALPQNEAFDFVASPGSPLHDAIVSAQGTAHQTVTVVMNLSQEQFVATDPSDLTNTSEDGSDPNISWYGFNYSFYPKENANGTAPSLNIAGVIPEPASLTLLGLSGIALLLRRRA